MILDVGGIKMVEDVKHENQRKVIHVADLESEVLGTLISVQDEFWAQRPGHRISSTMQHSATYLFETVDDAQCFGQLLDQREIPYSCHPAKDYHSIATQDMDDFGKALHRSFR